MAKQAIEKAQSSPLFQYRQRLIDRRDELQHALGGTGIGVDRFIRAAVTCAQISPELAETSFQSLWLALLRACRDGLLPDGVQGVIVPYKKRATWIPMYRGLISKFEHSGQFKWIAADFHRADDSNWDAWIDEHGQHFLHRPGPRQGQILETFACATTINGGFFVSILTADEMARLRNMSRAEREDAPWNLWPEEMMKKSALKRLCKLLPMPAPLEDIIHRDDAALTGNDNDELDELERQMLERPRTANAALAQFAGQAEPTTPPPAPAPTPTPSPTPSPAPTPTPTPTPPPTPSPTPTQFDLLKDEPPPVYRATAYERGRQAFNDNDPRELPEEYRDPKRKREAEAWHRGFDGEPYGEN